MFGSKCFVCIGRQANVKALNLSDIGIEYNEKGITVDEHLQTNVKGVLQSAILMENASWHMLQLHKVQLY